jgi:hypothetical protein
MEDSKQHQRGREPEAHTLFLGRSVVEDPEIKEPTILRPEFNEKKTIVHEKGSSLTIPTSQVNVNGTTAVPSRRMHGRASNVSYAQNLYEAEVVTDRPRKRNTTTIVLAVFGMSAIIGAIVVLGVCFSGDCGSNDSSKNLPAMTRSPTYPPTVRPTSSPTAPPIDIMAERVVSAFVNNITYLEQEVTVNGTSAESRALTWLIQEDASFNRSDLLTISSLSNDNEVSRRLRQRYPLVTLWYQQADGEGNFVNTWGNTSGWLQAESECNWFGIVCDPNGSVVQIAFYDYDKNSTNKYVGSIPPDIGLLTSLQGILMHFNDVTGTIPESVGQCSQMSIFDIAYGSVSGTLPSSMGRWTDMFVFDVSANDIIGSMPESVSSWTNIVGFSVFGNQLTGSIPSLILQWSQLQYFAVFDNKLTNTIPEDIGNLNKLILFATSLNSLTGTLPASIGKLTALTGFFVQVNQLSGTIPPSIGNWSLIERAYFATNRFTGTMPQEICANIQEGDILWSDCEVNCTCCTLACLS